eukprot:symbB.v1.2.002632.t1/scaffold139.1/size300179/15
MTSDRKRRKTVPLLSVALIGAVLLVFASANHAWSTVKVSGRSDHLTRRASENTKKVDAVKEVKEPEGGDPKAVAEEEGDPYAFFVPGVVFFLYLGFGTIYSTEYFMPMGDVGGKVAVAFGVLFVLLVVGVALKEVMD